ncbi:zinc-dependent alcohol dehydrogenase family protein [Methylophaga nitratireducenticrescens]|uniref:Quinone oxidoreductase n=1 Tax=Methylophaga nitratireducenticrescens TaxID=754476 RepID=I1XLW2_METNJ|nr:zinc-dependent alcohol dehydrogenase family protein [Methylophaga nitratireducenticrescens]AFI85381.1 NADPH:quinone reductase [Methylophaga nitratireducenticrescens]AUZ85156.1 NADPH:quinone reductase [Methylophaga nitratireducenticrescens]
MTRTVRFHQTGGPDVLQLDELTVSAPLNDEVLIKINTIGLNRAETMFRSGQYLETPTLPARLGYEASGVVEHLGPNVTRFNVGDKVNVIPAFSMNQYGTYAEKAVVPIHALVKQPANISDSEAAAVWMQYLTAWGALIDIGQLSKNQILLIPAASSSVGLAAIQIANQVGAIPVAITRSANKKDLLLKHGAKHVIISESQQITEQVLLITGGKGADMVFDPVAGPTLNDLANACGQFAQIFVYGALNPQPTPFPLLTALGKGLNFRGYTLFEFTQDAERLQKGVEFIENGLAAGHLKPIIAKTFALDDIVAAHQYMESNQQIGKIIVKT